MLESNAMVSVSLHYWAGARAAAGVAEEAIEAQSVAEALRLACQQRSDPRFERVIKMSSVLIDGRAAHQEDLERQLTEAVQIEVLPPFAGGT
jgi:molybdopterin synthase sulfur carrier subunit